MSDRHVVMGAGHVGTATARALAARGAEVVLASRSGAGAPVEGTTRVAVDAADPEALSRLAEGSVAIHNCLNAPAYHQWPTFWPPVAAALLSAAERSGAVLVTVGNLYPYGDTGAPMAEGRPDAPTGTKSRIRAAMTADALAAHGEGKIRAVEVRASDFVGAGPGDYAHVPRVVGRALAGRAVRVFGSPDQPHTWTHVADLGRTLAAVATDESTWGRVWHAPSNPPRTQREALADICAAVGRPAPQVRAMPRSALAAGGLVVPVLRELRETSYQFTRPFVMESAATTEALGLHATPWEEVCRLTA